MLLRLRSHEAEGEQGAVLDMYSSSAYLESKLHVDENIFIGEGLGGGRETHEKIDDDLMLCGSLTGEGILRAKWMLCCVLCCVVLCRALMCSIARGTVEK